MEKTVWPGRLKRRILRILLGLIAFLLISSFIFDRLVQFRMSDKQLMEYFASNKIKGEVRYYSAEGRKLRYVAVGNDSLPILLFIHGSPSSLSIFKEYYRDSLFLTRFKMYAIDRPGYGGSDFGTPEPSIQKQSEMIRPILDSLNKARKPIIIMGGSYGSSIACRLTMDHPDLVDGLILVAPCLAPGEEKIFGISPLIEHPFLNWGVPRIFKAANTEKLHHKAELTKMLPYWKNIRVPVMYMQGAKDMLVYTSNADFACRQLINAPFLDIQFFKGRPHFIPIAERPAIRKKILEMYERIRNK